MKNCLVIGGGLAGLSSAVYLSEKKYKVTILEASPKLGGRAYSLYNPKYDDYYDNGQHIMMGCYYETIDFLKKINSWDKIDFQDSLKINFVEYGGKVHKLSAPKYFYPFNILLALMNYSAVKFSSRLKIIDFMMDSLCCVDDALKNLTVEQWLKIKREPEDSIKALWDILIIGALNTTSVNASAQVFSEILKRIFFDGNNAASIIIPATDLSKMYINNSVEFLKRNGGSTIVSERVQRVEIDGNRITKIISDKNEYSDFDFVISSIPAYALEKIKINDNQNFTELINIPSFKYSPILNAHLWLKENPFKEKFYGLIDAPVHWLFNHGKHISLTTSSAEGLIGLNDKEILSVLNSCLELFFPIFKQDLVADFKIIKEKRATFIPDISSTLQREKIKSPLDNFILAGDWVNTGLPSTIESAVLSGRLAADEVVKNLR